RTPSTRTSVRGLVRCDTSDQGDTTTTGPKPRVEHTVYAEHDGRRQTVEAQRRAELNWIFRPAPIRPEQIRALAGMAVHATGPVGVDGEADVVLRDGTRVRVKPVEIVAE